MTKHRFLGLLLGSAFILGVAATAQGASYYIPSGTNTPEAYPTVSDFNWIRTGDSYGYSGAFNYTDGANLSYTIDFTLYAPDNWTNPATQGGNDYTGYRPENDGYSDGMAYDGNVNSLGSDPGNFDNVYAYFYELTVTGTESLESLRINYSNATLADFGYITGAGTAPSTMTDTAGSRIDIDFGAGLASSGTSTFYLTSRSWYGWDTANGTGSSSNSASGGLPSPNPEASTMALYLAGLMGLAGYHYLKRRGQGAWG